jgi:hypothetical protein
MARGQAGKPVGFAHLELLKTADCTVDMLHSSKAVRPHVVYVDTPTYYLGWAAPRSCTPHITHQSQELHAQPPHASQLQQATPPSS